MIAMATPGVPPIAMSFLASDKTASSRALMVVDMVTIPTAECVGSWFLLLRRMAIYFINNEGGSLPAFCQLLNL